MQKSNDDCYYFLTSSCAKGSTCSYRHNSTVLTCNAMCPAWLRGSCIDSACQLRHSPIQSPAVNTAKSCYYENTHMGCLKLDCTFAHIRHRPTSRNSSAIRSSSTNLVNKDVIKSTTSANLPSSPTNIPTIAAVASTNGSIPSSQIDLSQSSIPKVEVLLQSETPTTPISNETTPCRTAISTENEQIEISSRNVVTNSSEETKSTTTQSRVVGNRNVVIADSSNRKIVQATTNRVVVSSDAINASKRIINNNDSDSDRDLDDLIQEDNNNMKKLNSVIDISFPCAAPSITNRFLTSNTPITPTNDTKPIRLNRDRLPAAKITISNSSSSTSTNGEKTSAGTELTQDDERRTSRIERFKNKSSPSPRSLINTPSSISARNVVTVSTNERKRQIPESSVNDDPPLKRRSGQQENNNNNNNNKHHHHHNTATIDDLCLQPSNPRRKSDRHRRRSSSSSSSGSSSSSSSSPSQRKSPPRVNYSTKLSMDDSAWKRQVDEFLAKTTQPKPFVPSIPSSFQPVPLLSLRPRFIPPLLSLHRPTTPRYSSIPQRPRQTPKVSIQRPPPPAVNNLPPVLSKPVEPTPVNKTSPIQPSTILNDEDENKLLELDEPTDVVDTFAFIDEALFETDDLVELM
ncbi:unnamed protein product [Rotaria socialis]|uniref:C3H1-type domain-containing protein n=1 Tax=Rotaria socialis TaxID=392032 RepID=A0A818HIJ7_9BILA|nr:unnamed protein product [Rotaria socialis]CAF4498630.1 unnamed protein product [Rotaria socialis]